MKLVQAFALALYFLSPSLVVCHAEKVKEQTVAEKEVGRGLMAGITAAVEAVEAEGRVLLDAGRSLLSDQCRHASDACSCAHFGNNCGWDSYKHKCKSYRETSCHDCSTQQKCHIPHPTEDPTHHPTKKPTHHPTKHPTHHPTHHPTKKPTHHPTKKPTHHPTKKPTHHPTKDPTHHPTKHPTHHPTKDPTHHPTKDPTYHPTEHTNVYGPKKSYNSYDSKCYHASDACSCAHLGKGCGWDSHQHECKRHLVTSCHDCPTQPVCKCQAGTDPCKCAEIGGGCGWSSTVHKCGFGAVTSCRECSTQPQCHTDQPAAHPTEHPTEQPAAHPTEHPTKHPIKHKNVSGPKKSYNSYDNTDDSMWHDKDGDGCSNYARHPRGAKYACTYPGYEDALTMCKKTCGGYGGVNGDQFGESEYKSEYYKRDSAYYGAEDREYTAGYYTRDRRRRRRRR